MKNEMVTFQKSGHYCSSVRTTRTRTYVHGTVLHVVHMYTNTGTFVLYMYILIHAYMYATESKVLGLDQIGGFQTTEPSLYLILELSKRHFN